MAGRKRTPPTKEGRQLRLLQGERVNRQGGESVVGQNGKCNTMKKDKSGRCQATAGMGTDHYGFGACVAHGGNSEGHRKKASRLQIQAMAQELEVDPVTALLSTVHMTAGMVAWLRNQIETIELDVFEGSVEEQLAALGVLESLAELYSTERNNLAKMSKMAIDAGIAERQVQLAEAQAAMLVMAMRGVLDGLSLSPEQQSLAPALIRRHLLAIPAQTSEAR